MSKNKIEILNKEYATPLNGRPGFYLCLQAPKSASLKFIRNYADSIALQNGYDPEGDVAEGIPVSKNLSSMTISFWYYDKLNQEEQKSNPIQPLINEQILNIQMINVQTLFLERNQHIIKEADKDYIQALIKYLEASKDYVINSNIPPHMKGEIMARIDNLLGQLKLRL